MSNNTEYRMIDGAFSLSLGEAVRLLRRHHADGEKVAMVFNGVTLYSDTVTMDSAYLAVTGKTKAEYDKDQEEWRKQMLRHEAEHKAKIPELTIEWIKRGHEVLDEKYWAKWDECVPIRLDDIYEGWELGGCLDLVTALNSGCTVIEARAILDEQGHSGMSYALMLAMVRTFCDRGEEFYKYIKCEQMSFVKHKIPIDGSEGEKDQ